VAIQSGRHTIKEAQSALPQTILLGYRIDSILNFVLGSMIRGHGQI
jgi:hypothetical protein